MNPGDVLIRSRTYEGPGGSITLTYRLHVLEVAADSFKARAVGWLSYSQGIICWYPVNWPDEWGFKHEDQRSDQPISAS